MPLEFPSGPLPFNSPFYIPRPPIEELAYQEIAKPGSVTRIKAPRHTGKSSLIVRIINRARQLGYKTVTLDLQQVDEEFLLVLNRFLRWFCAGASQFCIFIFSGNYRGVKITNMGCSLLC